MFPISSTVNLCIICTLCLCTDSILFDAGCVFHFFPLSVELFEQKCTLLRHRYLSLPGFPLPLCALLSLSDTHRSVTNPVRRSSVLCISCTTICCCLLRLCRVCGICISSTNYLLPSYDCVEYSSVGSCHTPRSTHTRCCTIVSFSKGLELKFLSPFHVTQPFLHILHIHGAVLPWLFAHSS